MVQLTPHQIAAYVAYLGVHDVPAVVINAEVIRVCVHGLAKEKATMLEQLIPQLLEAEAHASKEVEKVKAAATAADLEAKFNIQ